ncbi:DUF3251 domain-containing protein, partial [Escherichia coli]|uniref:DUF3251 domain-containing protein n=2 Tax=Escherichia coli TaxID=562 RepID=UPI001F130290
TNRPLTDFGGKTSIFSHPVYLFLREFSLQDFRGGSLRMSLVNITPDTDGTTLTLRIQGESNDPLPAFSGTVEYGQIQGTIDNFQEINVQNQLINAPASVLAPSDVDIPLQLKGISVDQLGFVRIHDIQPVMQ